eukprot:c18717_g1_i3.p1 GENE.c18717_g1_i3~~c18717_g1_i3.p1  ORF type:complete len:524 (+),score=126.46 c18717_g1_i3:3-1574(+)
MGRFLPEMVDYFAFGDQEGRQRFERFENQANGLIAEIFNIIVEYPDSLSQVRELCVCLQQTHMYDKLADKLAQDVQNRLLVPGATTSTILAQFVGIIQVLEHIDQTGIILKRVGTMVRQYLRKRTDSTRCIINYLLSESGIHLLQQGRTEMIAGEEDGEEVEPEPDDESDDIEANPESWMPDAKNPDPTNLAIPFGVGRKTDTFMELVGVYGTLEPFVTEYCSLLSENLIAAKQPNIDLETRNLELLKLRFGEAALHNCEVMLRDVVDSRRVTMAIHSEHNRSGAAGLDSLSVMTPLIVSHTCWPEMAEVSFKPPNRMQALLDDYQAHFQRNKANRRLEWQLGLGTIDLELSFARTPAPVKFKVSPAQASVILLFGDHDTLTSSEIEEQLEMERADVWSALNYWVTLGVLEPKGSKEAFGVAEVYEASAEDGVGEMLNDAMDTDQAFKQDKTENDADQVHQRFVMGMLMNLSALPLSRIHNMLKMFVMEAPYDKTPEELHEMLRRMVRDGLLEENSGKFSRKT